MKRWTLCVAVAFAASGLLGCAATSDVEEEPAEEMEEEAERIEEEQEESRLPDWKMPSIGFTGTVLIV